MTPDQIVEFAEACARVAASGGGAKALATLLAERAGGGVLVEDVDWRPVATAGKGSLPATARGLNGGRARTVPIAAGDASFGWLSVIAEHDTDYDALLPVLRLAASAIAVELARDSAGGRGRKRAFWERLVDRAYADSTAAREDALARGVAIVNNYVCVALEADADEDPANAGEALRSLTAEAFRFSEGELGLIERGAALVAIVPAAREVDAENAKTAATLLPKTAAKRHLTFRLSGGISSVVALLEVARGVADAEASLAIARRIYGGGRIASYGELGAYPLLHGGADAEALRAFAEATLAPLRAYDDKHQTELERTLRLYFSTGENVKTAAAELNVHRHTVFYRLRQISEISGRTLESPHDQLTLRLAIAIDALHT
ncbi:MAG: helix-turn-helix domain-containing protein [Candidatus Eremiobacteraeota bacterium]|nr:helix-turn-helix domain-containing protein [Candidatus Eremiobacteraeota bacterium]